MTFDFGGFSRIPVDAELRIGSDWTGTEIV
jgi:hypothetical protein